MKANKRLLAVCIAIPLAVGGLSAWVTHAGMKNFEKLLQPPLSPPGWLFPVVWTVLFAMMGLASWLVIRTHAEKMKKKRALILYGIQLTFNFLWTVFFFNLQAFLFAAVWLAVLWMLIFATALLFGRLDKRAGFLLLPYLLWVTFAGYLNVGTWLLN